MASLAGGLPWTAAPPSLRRPLLPLGFSLAVLPFSPAAPRRLRRRPYLPLRCTIDSPERREMVFPGGFRRPKINVPTVILKVDVSDVLRFGDKIDSVLSEGLIGVVLLLGGDDSGGKLYEAACLLKSVVRDRAYFLVSERVDVAAAVGASGVVLSDQGLPVIVARNMIMSSRTEAVLLPLVGRILQKTDDAMSASASEGADLLIFRSDRKSLENVLVDCITEQNIKVPIFLDIVDWLGHSSSFDMASSILLQLGGSGFVLTLADMSIFKEGRLTMFPNRRKLDNNVQDESQILHNHEETPLLVGGFSKLSEKEIKLIEAERVTLLEAIEVIREAAPLVIF